MDKVIEAAKELRKELNKLPLFIEYERVKNLYESNDEIKELKKLIVRAKNENRLDEHKELLNKLHNHPLYLNYTSLEEDVRDYLREISKELN